MTARADDMVIRVSLGAAVKPSAPVRARQERAIERATRGKRSFAGTLVRARVARRALTRRTRTAPARRKAKKSKGGLKASAIAFALGVAASAVRLITGEPLEKIGTDMNRVLLGDLDDEARAAMSTRRRFTSDPEIARIVGREGQINAQIRSVAQDLKAIAYKQEKAASRMREALPLNSTVDNLILRAAESFRRTWASRGGPAATEKLKTEYGKLRGAPAGERGR